MQMTTEKGKPFDLTKAKRGRPNKNPQLVQLAPACIACGSKDHETTGIKPPTVAGTAIWPALVEGQAYDLIWTATKYLRCKSCGQSFTVKQCEPVPRENSTPKSDDPAPETDETAKSHGETI